MHKFVWRGWLTAVILLAFALRLHQLEQFSFWIDEALTPLRTAQGVGDIIAGRTFIQEAVSQDTHPPLYYLLVKATRALWGESDFAYRYFSVLWGVLLVPLLAQFGRRLAPQQGWWVGGWAALLIAINPLHVWYAQEARMYTLLVFWGAAMSYVLWHALQRPPHGRDLGRALALYALCAFLTLYTHYTAIFLISAQLLLWAWVLWQAGYKRLIGVGVAAVLLALIPLVPLTLPRLFTGAEAGYTYLSPLIMLNDLVGGFSMGVTAPPVVWLRNLLWWGMAAVLAVGLWQAGRGKNGRARFLLLASYLTITLIGLALGSLLKPMYQGVRHIMLGSPAFVLLAALALQGSRGAEKQRSNYQSPITNYFLPLTFYFLLLTSSLLSLHSRYTNPEVAKDDVRRIVAYVEERAGSDDIIVYNDAILMLVHWHYATRADLLVTAAPIYPHPADERTAAQITQMGNDYGRVWFIPAPPSDGRDPLGHAQTWMRQGFALRDEHFFTARSTELKVELYDTVPLTATLPASTGWQWEGLPTLHTLNLLDVAPRAIWLEAIWSGAPPADEARLIFALRGADGRVWHGVNMPFGHQTLWPDTAARLSYAIPLPLGMPAGDYAIELVGWDDTRQQSLGAPQPVQTITLPPQTAALTSGVQFGNGLRLAEVAVPDNVGRPGLLVPIAPLWHTATAVSTAALRADWQLLDPTGAVAAEGQELLGASWLADWPAQTAVRGQMGVRFPTTAVAGTYQLRWRLVQDGQPVVGRWGREWYELGELIVEDWPLITEPPEMETAVNAQWGDEITLLGYDGAQTAEQLTLNLVWRAEKPPSTSYFVFVHLASAATGEIVRQRDWFPAEGIRPTEGWRPSEIILDPHTLDLTGLPAGEYRLTVGLYNPEDFTRPVVMLGGAEQSDRQLLLQELTIE